MLDLLNDFCRTFKNTLVKHVGSKYTMKVNKCVYVFYATGLIL